MKKKDTVERNKLKKKSNTFLRDHKTIMKFFNMQKKTDKQHNSDRMKNQ